MLNIYDRTLQKRGVLENAFDRVETQQLNGVGTFTFSLPEDDPKAALCGPFCFIRNGKDGAYYRILVQGGQTGETGVLTYECEHAIATLVDDVLFGTHMIGGTGVHTREVLQYVLDAQTVKHWQLGSVEIDKQFEYGFESENLLSALFAVPNLFVEPYMWHCDMRSYPWTVSLKRLGAGDAQPYQIRAGKNLIEARHTKGGGSVCTRLYLLGYGEGDNQLTIRDVNGGVPYLQSPPEVVARYGLISKVYVDRSFEDAQSLLARGQALLAAMQEPACSRTFAVADLYPLTGDWVDHAAVGDVARFDGDGTLAYITSITRRLDIDGDMRIEISNTPHDIAADIADIADRQRIEQVYAQGATQIYAQSIQANATSSTQAVLNFYIPQAMRIVNKVVAKISLDRFRSYSRMTNSGGRSTQTSSAGGGAVATSSAGGGSTATTTAAGETTVSAAQTVTLDSGVGFTTDASSIAVTGEAHPGYGTSTGSAAATTGTPSPGQTGAASLATGVAGSGQTGGSRENTGTATGNPGHSHYMYHTHTQQGHSHSVPGHSHSMPHVHGVSGHAHPIGGHRHSMSHTHSLWHQHKVPGHSHSLPSHQHRVTVAAHTHSVTVPGHTHGVTVPDHTHEITQGVFRFGSPKTAKVYVDGVERFDMGEDREVDLTGFLLGKDGKVPRGRWIRLGVLPDDLAYVTIDIVVQGFVQSRATRSGQKPAGF